MPERIQALMMTLLCVLLSAPTSAAQPPNSALARAKVKGVEAKHQGKEEAAILEIVRVYDGPPRA